MLQWRNWLARGTYIKIINLIALLRTSNSLLNPSLLKHLGGAMLHSS